MIETTDEMVREFMRAAAQTPVQVAGRELLNARAGVAAVLAIVERDHRVVPRCADVDCERGGHGGDHGCFDGREWVRWS